MNDLKNDPGRLSYKAAESEVAKLRAIEGLGLSPSTFAGLSSKAAHHYCSRIESEPPSRTLERTEISRYALVAIYCWLRRQDVIDSLVELVVQTVHKLSRNAEQRVVEEIVREIRKVKGKHTLH